MIRRPPRSTLDRSSAASDVYKRQTNVLGYVGVYWIAIMIGVYLVTATGADWITSLSAVVSCLGGVGPGMGGVGPYDNYAWMAPFAKWVLAACMLLGRLEFFSLLILFSPAYWHR